MQPFHLLLLALGTWRLSSLFAREKGPGALFLRIREACGIKHDETGTVLSWPDAFLPELLQCVWCSSVWIGAANVVVYAIWPETALWLNLPLAISAVAVLVDRLVQ